MTRDEVTDALRNSQLDRLIGVDESEWLDFKREPYNLADDWKKFELAKDVSALANLDGGLIVMGYRAEKPADSDRELAVELRAMPRNLVSETQYRDVIRTHVYPTVGGLEIVYAPKPDDAERGVFVILIPPQDQAARPFLVAKPMLNETTRVRGWLFGIARRSFDSTEVHRIGEVHSQLSQSQTLGPRLDAFEAALARLGSTAQEEPPGEEEATTDPDGEGASLDITADEPALAIDDTGEGDSNLEETMDDALTQRGPFHGTLLRSKVSDRLKTLPDGPANNPLLYLAATPLRYTKIPTLFRREGVREVLEAPPATRASGWNLATLDRARIERGSLLAVNNGDRKHLALHEDGTFVAIAAFPSFLARDRVGQFLKVNPLALVEFTHDFVLTYSSLADHFEPVPTTAMFGSGLRNAQREGHALLLPPNGIKSYDFLLADPEDHPPIDSDSYDWNGVLPVGEQNVGQSALAILERLYAAFGREFDVIPYKSEDATRIDPATF